MTRYGMIISTKKCVGCYACSVSCQMKNNLTPDKFFIKYSELETGCFPNVYAEQVPVQCMHCTDAPCQTVCPTGATYTTDSGVVLVEEEKCIGCKYCMVACPYDARVQLHSGVAAKCRFCWESNDVGTPACVSTCLTNARVFGDLDDPTSEISQQIAQNNALPLVHDMTESNIYYVR